MKRNKLFSLLLVVVFSLIGCTTTEVINPIEKVVPLQSLSDEGDTIILIDALKEKELITALLGEEIGNRAKQITIEIIPTSDNYPLDTFDYNAVVEGDFPYFLTNLTLNHLTDYEKMMDLQTTYYKTEDTELGVIHENMVGATNASYLELVKTIDSEVSKVDSETAQEMYGNNFALFSQKPKTLFDFGIGLTDAMVKHFDTLLLLVNEGEENQMLLTAKFEVDTENNAKTLDRMIKSGYTGTLKKAGEKLDFAKLKLMFVREGDIVNIIDMPLTDEQMNLLKKTITASNVGI